MSEITRVLSAIEQGDPHAAEQLLPLVYDELRKLAAQMMAQEAPGQRILIDQARHKHSAKRGGTRKRVPLDELAPLLAPEGEPGEDLIALDEALQQLEAEDPIKAQLVKLRYFTGASLEESARMLGISAATAKRHWVYARSWLFGKLHGD